MQAYAIIHTASRIVRAVVDQPPSSPMPDETLVRLNATLAFARGHRLAANNLETEVASAQDVLDEALSAAVNAAPILAAQEALDATHQARDADRRKLGGLRARINALQEGDHAALQTVLRRIVAVLESAQ